VRDGVATIATEKNGTVVSLPVLPILTAPRSRRTTNHGFQAANAPMINEPTTLTMSVRRGNHSPIRRAANPEQQ
jgi:hypothetical protein